jgi:hypothetical protein
MLQADSWDVQAAWFIGGVTPGTIMPSRVSGATEWRGVAELQLPQSKHWCIVVIQECDRGD